MMKVNCGKLARCTHSWAQAKWAGVVLLISIVIGVLGTAQQSVNGPLGDYGDAPDSQRASYDHVDPTIVAAFPSTYKSSSDPSFIVHQLAKDGIFLGKDVTLENNALEVDRDLDDGWIPNSFLTCSVVDLQIFVTIPAGATAGPLYLNSLFDWNHDGHWADFSKCDSKQGEITTAEWAIQNLRLDEEPYNLKPGFSGTISLPMILTGPLSGEMWIRFTVTTEKVDENFFKPVEVGGRGWNGEGYFNYGETEDYFICLLASRESIIAGCPALLLNQSPVASDGSPTENRPPNALPDTISTDEDTPVTVDVKANDSDPDNDVITVISLTQPNHGGAVLNANNTATYAPDDNYHGSDTFTYTISDGHDGSDTAIVTIIIFKEAAVANNDSASTPEDTPVAVNVLNNDIGDMLSISGHTNPTHGTVSCTSTTCTYTPSANYNGSDSFTYTIPDGRGGSSTATVSISITPVNDAPVAQSQQVTTPEDTPVSITLVCTDVDGDALSFLLASLGKGTGKSLTGTPPNLTYTPPLNFNGSFSFQFKCNDGHANSNVATVSVTVTPVNDPPLADANGPYVCTEGQTITLSSAGSTDLDGTIVQFAWDLDNNGSYETLDENPQFQCSSTGVFIISLLVTDNDGAVSTTPSKTTVTVNVVGANNPPQADNLSVTTEKNTAISGSLPVSDPDNDPLTCSLILQASHGTAVVNSDCTYTYTPDTDSTAPDQFQYQVSDGQATDPGVVTISISQSVKACKKLPCP
ncbi:tandem-95 repeat protein [Candidatus Acetothermia bacterium]|nr:tandem-95 repeat protein [Candidatus Acetothermia bacterium]